MRLRGPKEKPDDDAAQKVRALEKKVEDLEYKLERASVKLMTIERPKDKGEVLLDYPKAEIKLVYAAQGRSRACVKEPLTVSWIERLRPNDVFYDIGANVGAYSLIAAAAADESVRIWAFEPGYSNFAILCDNILTNDFDDRIAPMPVTLGSNTALGTFSYRFVKGGGARHHSKQSDAPDFRSVYDQRVITYRLDDLISQFGLPTPTHIKLDVDGAEREVLVGAERTLRSDALRSVLVEVGEGDEDVKGLLQEAGLELGETYESKRVWYGVFERS